MNKPDYVFRELGQLYDFYKEIAKFKKREATKESREEKPNRDFNQDRADSEIRWKRV